MNYVLIYFAYKYKGDFDAIYKALKTNEILDKKTFEYIKSSVDSGKIQAITILDDQYPEVFKYLAKPPFVIFYKGNWNLINNSKIISLTGQFKNSNVEQVFEKAIAEVAKNYVLVTSYFPNLEKEIVHYYQRHAKPIIYISCNGVEDPYFASEVIVSENNLIISEYPEFANVSKQRLRERNRLISALGESLVIFSSTKKSGIMNLVSNFLNMGKEIYCFPGEISDEDRNTELIMQGAQMITSISNIGALSK
ncbi:DNA-processing protein DprA [Candidatus Mycoplasma pogonae]